MMKKRALNKDIFIEILRSKTRFLSIMIMMALGAFVYTGLSSTGPIMRDTIGRYSSKYAMYDLKVSHIIGLEKEDKKLIEEIDGIDKVDFFYETNLYTEDQSHILRIKSKSEDISSYEIVEGKLPQKSGELTMDAKALGEGFSLGDNICLEDGEDLKICEFTIVGFVSSPEYILDMSRGSTNKGDGKVDFFAIVPEEDFLMDTWGFANIYFTDLKGLDCCSELYKDRAKVHQSKVEDIFKKRPELRLEKIKEEVLDDIEKGEEEIADAKEFLNKLKIPNYNIGTPYDNEEFHHFLETADQVDLLSKIFPPIFYLIAIMVSLTTMTLMVDEERTQIGTLKAIGYNNKDIIKKYLIYGLLSGTIGCIIGVFTGNYYLSQLVYSAYASGSIFQNRALVSFYPRYATVALMLTILSIGLSTWLAFKNSFKNNAAILMRPKVPKSGSRIFLENLRFIWNRLSFIAKVTARNIFRYKKRMLMTILGVTGCTGLIFMGFVVKDSVAGIMTNQMDELTHYDMIVLYNSDAKDEDIHGLQNLIQQNDNTSKHELVSYNMGSIEIDDAPNEKLSIIVAQNPEEFKKLVTIQDRKTKEDLPLKENTAIITEKIATLNGLSVGDEFSFLDGDGYSYSVEITGIAENYIGHNLFLTEDSYQNIFGKKPVMNGNYLSFYDNDKETIKEYSKILFENDAVLYTRTTFDLTDLIEELLNSLNKLVAVIILVSSALAIVVLYNLTNINVSERIRELSTIKVLGFYAEETTAYVYRETLSLTIIGIFIGYGLGHLLHKMIQNALSSNKVMMDPQVYFYNYFISAGFTLGFSLIVMLIIHKKLKKVDMVEALKGVE